MLIIQDGYLLFAPQVVDGVVDDDALEPATKLSFSSEVVDFLKSFNERVLHDVFGLCSISHDAQTCIVHGMAVKIVNALLRPPIRQFASFYQIGMLYLCCWFQFYRLVVCKTHEDLDCYTLSQKKDLPQTGQVFFFPDSLSTTGLNRL